LSQIPDPPPPKALRNIRTFPNSFEQILDKNSADSYL
jgi:hypothetical protein